MANSNFNVDKKLSVTGSGSLGQAMRFLKENTLAVAIPKSIEAFQEIDKQYRKAVANDGKIIGTERTDILDRVDLLMDIMILAWKQTGNRGEECRIRVENKEKNFLFEITEANGLWKASGRLTPSMTRPAKNFNELYNARLAPEIIALLKTYREACADNVIDQNEKESLRHNIKQVIYYVLFLRFQLEKCLISE